MNEQSYLTIRHGIAHHSEALANKMYRHTAIFVIQDYQITKSPTHSFNSMDAEIVKTIYKPIYDELSNIIQLMHRDPTLAMHSLHGLKAELHSFLS